MSGIDKGWMDILDRFDPRYRNGINAFLDWAFHEDQSTIPIRGR